MVEIWKPVVDFENLYEVSNMGRVKSIRRNKILVGGKDTDGYSQVLLCKNGERKCRKIHKLEWCSIKYNNTYGTSQKRGAEKRSKPVVQILNNEVIAIYKSAVEASNITGINYSKIRMCCRNERKTAGGYEWKNIK